MYEVFWADLKPDIRGLGLVAFLFKLILALSQLGAEGWRDADTGANVPSYAGRLLKDLLFGNGFVPFTDQNHLLETKMRWILLG